MIIVGIDNSSRRSQDLLPQFEGVGNFLTFIQEELIPYVDGNYRTKPTDRTLAGGSDGCIFALYTLFHIYRIPSRDWLFLHGSYYQGKVILCFKNTRVKKQLFPRLKAFRGLVLLLLLIPLALLLGEKTSLAAPPPSAAVSILTTVDSTGYVSLDTSLALNSNGFPVISYYDSTNDDLKVAVCNNATCSTPTITPVDTPGEVGKYTTLALTSSDYPIISYYDETNNDLKIAVCNDISCTNPTLTTVDSPGFVGQYNSLALDSDGYPVVSYYDGSPNVDLKVAVFDPSAGISPYNIYLPLVIR